jgi:hypothetical protein
MLHVSETLAFHHRQVRAGRYEFYNPPFATMHRDETANLHSHVEDGRENVL